jgi:hypothetical protein
MRRYRREHLWDAWQRYLPSTHPQKEAEPAEPSEPEAEEVPPVPEVPATMGSVGAEDADSDAEVI